MSEQKGRPRRRRTFGRRVAWIGTLTIALGVVVWAYQYYTSPDRVRRLAELYIQSVLGGTVHIGSAELSLTSGLQLFDVRVDAPDPDPLQPSGVDTQLAFQRGSPWPGDQPIFSCRRLAVRHNPWATLLGRLEITSIQAEQPSCTIVHDTLTGHSSLAQVIGRLRGHSSTNKPGIALPLIELRDAQVRVLARNTVGTRRVEDLRLTLRGGPAQGYQGQYDIVWHVPGESAPGGHSRLDLKTGYLKNVQGGLPAMSIEAVMLAINARYDGVGAWNKLLGLGGRVRARDFDLIGVGDAGRERSVTIELSDATVSIPVNDFEHDLPRTERYLRFLDVNGSIMATTRELRADFAGSLRGASCRVDAAFRGDASELRSLEDVGFDVHLAMRSFPIPRNDEFAPPEEARFVNHFKRLADNIRTFDPYGVVDVDVHVSRAIGPEESIKLRRALITLQGNDVSCSYFPYRGTGVTGEIEITPDGVFVRGLRGEHDGAEILLDGRMDAPNQCSRGTFTIQAQHVPIDDALLNALKEKDRETALSFSPAGVVDVNVDLQREACVGDQERGTWKSIVDIFLTGEASASYEHFPYRMDQIEGHVIIGEGEAQVVNVRGIPSSSHIGEIQVNGAVGFGGGAVQSVDLVVDGDGINLDESFTRALPESYREKLRAFDAKGRFDIQTRVGFDPARRKLQHESDVELLGVSVEHEALPLTVSDIFGPMTVRADRIETPGLAGRCRDTLITLRGTVDPADPMRHTEVFVSCHGATLDDATLAYVPKVWRDRMGPWRIDSPVDLDLEVRTVAGDEPQVDVHGVARMADAVVRHEQRGLILEEVHGEIAFDRDSLHGLDVTGRWGDAPIRTSFEIGSGTGDESGVASFEARNVALDERTRAILPPRAQSAWDRLKPDGHADVIIDRFAMSPKPENPAEQATCLLDGRLILHDVSLRASDTPKHMSGEVHLSGNMLDRLSGTVLAGSAQLKRMTLLDRDLEDVDADWSFVHTLDGRGRFEIARLQGDLYGGSVAGDLELNFGEDQSTYRLSTTIQDADLNPLLNASRSRSDQSEGPIEARGRVNAHTYLSGILGDRASRRGGGQFRIAQGRIYDLPLMAAIFHVLNISLPSPADVQEADASFFVMGVNVEIGPLSFRGGGIQLVGTGTMTMSDYVVDLHLANVNPRQWGRIPVLADFVEGASRELVGLQITGPLAHPTVRTRPLGGLSDEFKKLFQKRESPPIVRSRS